MNTAWLMTKSRKEEQRLLRPKELEHSSLYAEGLRKMSDTIRDRSSEHQEPLRCLGCSRR